MVLKNLSKSQLISSLALFILGTITITTYLSYQEASQPIYHKEDKRLEKFIRIFESEQKKPWSSLEPQQHLKVGMENKDIIELRRRLKMTGELAESTDTNDPVFDEKLKQAVERYQKHHSISATGEVDNKTLAALNISPQMRLKQLQKNSERWARFEQKRENRFLWVNIPSFSAKLVENNKITFKEKVIFGKPSHPTPVLYSEITDVMLNPYWIVPASLAQRAIIPKLSQNDNLLNERNMQLYNAKTEEPLSSKNLDVAELSRNINDYFFRQEPGPLNPLGQIKFKITNSSSIYLHDTNTKELFNNQYRALSSGCIRLKNPLNLFTKIIEDDISVSQTKNKLKKLADKDQSHNIKLENPLPVFITYMTAWVDDKGGLNIRDDIYKHDFS